MSSSQHVNELVQLNILSNEQKQAFIDYCHKHGLVLEVEHVEAIGYKGRTKYVPINDPTLFSCCVCGKYSTSGYIGMNKFDCEHETCYGCALGESYGTFVHCAKNCTVIDCDHSTDDEIS